MALAIEEFKGKLTGGGVRPALFRVDFSFPAFIQADANLASFLCKGAQLPPSNVASTPVPFRGRTIKIPAERTGFDDMSFTIINDDGFNLRNGFERWLNQMNSHEANLGDFTLVTGDRNVKSNLVVNQMNRNGDIIKAYTLVGAFPTSVSEISVSYDATGIEEFTVSFAYDYWISNTTT
jgi:hypothetical protein